MSWTNSTDGPGSVTLVYDGVDTWASGCTVYTGGSGQAINITVSCAGGELSIEIDFDEDNSDCSDSRVFDLTFGLSVTSSSCTPLDIEIAVSSSVRLYTTEHFRTFTLTP